MHEDPHQNARVAVLVKGAAEWEGYVIGQGVQPTLEHQGRLGLKMPRDTWPAVLIVLLHQIF